ncbi:protein FAM183A isoform X1 [Antechinus flavipes]|uniref:protein FAM183A isoform X1 n=1 Tax=Antechinus flavipes TaxID=38775 RepID=UPI0022360E08|nr:protein FAM183A isoform X1 [Antechinus flavipes]
MASRGREKAPPDPVHQNQIMCELIRKELRAQKLYTEYNVNPHHQVHNITRKPMSWHDNVEEPADAKFLNVIHYAAQRPKKKYSEPQTESQEIGWDCEPLVSEPGSQGWPSGRLQISPSLHSQLTPHSSQATGLPRHTDPSHSGLDKR